MYYLHTILIHFYFKQYHGCFGAGFFSLIEVNYQTPQTDFQSREIGRHDFFILQML